MQTAIEAIRHPDSKMYKGADGKPTIILPGEKPAKGTQSVYSKNLVSKGKMKAYAWTDKGLLKAWHVER